MKLPLQITFRQMEPSPAIEARIRELATKLEIFSSQITRCHVIVEPLAHHQRQGALFDFHLNITVPQREFAIRGGARPHDHSHEDPYVALRDAFRAARRKLQDYERRRRRDTKIHTHLPEGRICELDAGRGFGRIETDDGRLIYFHRNSLLGARFEDLTPGLSVRFAEEPGELGPQASTVHVNG